MKINTMTMLRNLFWMALAGCLGAVCLAAVDFKKQVALKGISVDLVGAEQGVYFMRPENIESEIRKIIGPLEKHTVGDISCDIIEEVLSKNPFIRTVDVYVSGNAVLVARITQREPVLRVFGEGQSFYLDSEGKRIPVSPHYTPRVHVLTGPGAAQHAEAMLDMVMTISRDGELNALVGQIEVISRDEIVIIPTVGRARILMGDTSRMTEKFENLKAFYREVMAESGWDRYHSIDLRFRNQIICKKNPTS